MSEKSKGVFYILLSAGFFSVMNMLIKLSGDIPTFEKSFFRNLVAAVVAFVLLKKSKMPLKLPGESRKYVQLRSVAGTIGIFANFYAVSHIALADASMLNKLSPFFSIIFSYLLIKEAIRPYQLGCVITAFIGALFILKPGASIGSGAAVIGAIGGLAAGLAYTFVRMASKAGAAGPMIVFCFSTFSCLCSVPLTMMNYQPLSIRQICILLAAGVFAAGGQFSITASYSHAPASEVSVYNYTQIVYTAILGLIFFGEIPDGWSILGYIFICGSGILMYLIKKRRGD